MSSGTSKEARKKAQKDYFLKHNINEAVEGAVATMLQTMPADPVRFLAAYFRGKATKTTPPPSPVTATAAATASARKGSGGASAFATAGGDGAVQEQTASQPVRVLPAGGDSKQEDAPSPAAAGSAASSDIPAPSSGFQGLQPHPPPIRAPTIAVVADASSQPSAKDAPAEEQRTTLKQVLTPLEGPAASKIAPPSPASRRSTQVSFSSASDASPTQPPPSVVSSPVPAGAAATSAAVPTGRPLPSGIASADGGFVAACVEPAALAALRAACAPHGVVRALLAPHAAPAGSGELSQLHLLLQLVGTRDASPSSTAVGASRLLEVLLADFEHRAACFAFGDLPHLGTTSLVLSQFLLHALHVLLAEPPRDAAAVPGLDDTLVLVACDMLSGSGAYPDQRLLDVLPDVLAAQLAAAVVADADGSSAVLAAATPVLAQVARAAALLLSTEDVPVALMAKVQTAMAGRHAESQQQQQQPSSALGHIVAKIVQSWGGGAEQYLPSSADVGTLLLETPAPSRPYLLSHFARGCLVAGVALPSPARLCRAAVDLFEHLSLTARNKILSTAGWKKEMLDAIDYLDGLDTCNVPLLDAPSAFLVSRADQASSAVPPHLAPSSALLPRNLLAKVLFVLRAHLKGNASARRVQFVLASAGVFLSGFSAFARALLLEVEAAMASDAFVEEDGKPVAALAHALAVLYADMCAQRLELFGQTAASLIGRKASTGDESVMNADATTTPGGDAAADPNGSGDFTSGSFGGAEARQKALREINRLRLLQTAFQDRSGSLFWDAVATHRDATLTRQEEQALFDYAEWNYLQLSDIAVPDKAPQWHAFVVGRLKPALRAGFTLEEYARLAAVPLTMLLTLEERPAGLEASASAASLVALPAVYFTVLSVAEACFAVARDAIAVLYNTPLQSAANGGGAGLPQHVATAAEQAYGEWVTLSQQQRDAMVSAVTSDFTAPKEKIATQAITTALRSLSRLQPAGSGAASAAAMSTILVQYVVALAAAGVPEYALPTVLRAMGAGAPTSALSEALALMGVLAKIQARQCRFTTQPRNPAVAQSALTELEASVVIVRAAKAFSANEGIAQNFSAPPAALPDDILTLLQRAFFPHAATVESPTTPTSPSDDALLTALSANATSDGFSRLLFRYGFTRTALQWLAHLVVRELAQLPTFKQLPLSAQATSLFAVLQTTEVILRAHLPRLSALVQLSAKLQGVDPQAPKALQRDVLVIVDSVMASAAIKIDRAVLRPWAAHSVRSIVAEVGAAVRSAAASRRRTLQMDVRTLAVRLAAKAIPVDIATTVIQSLIDIALLASKSKMVERDVSLFCNALVRQYEYLADAASSPTTTTAAFLHDDVLTPTLTEQAFLSSCTEQLTRELWGIPLVNVLACFVALRHENMPPTDQALRDVQVIVFDGLMTLCEEFAASHGAPTVVRKTAQADECVRDFLYFMTILSCGCGRGMLSYLTIFGEVMSQALDSSHVPGSHNKAGSGTSQPASPEASSLHLAIGMGRQDYQRLEAFAAVYAGVVAQVVEFICTTLEPGGIASPDAKGHQPPPVAAAAAGVLLAKLHASKEAPPAAVANQTRFSDVVNEARFAGLMYAMVGAMSPNSGKKINAALVSTSLETCWRSHATYLLEYEVHGPSLSLLDQVRESLNGTAHDLLQAAVFEIAALQELAHGSLSLQQVLCSSSSEGTATAVHRTPQQTVLSFLRATHRLITEVEDSDRLSCGAIIVHNKKELQTQVALINDQMQFHGLVTDEKMSISLNPLLRRPLVNLALEMAKAVTYLVNNAWSDETGDTAAAPGTAAADAAPKPLTGSMLLRGAASNRSFRSLLVMSSGQYVPHFAGLAWTSTPVEQMQLQGLVPRDITLLAKWVRKWSAETTGGGSAASPQQESVARPRLSLKSFAALVKQNALVTVWRSCSRTLFSMLRDRLVSSMAVSAEDKAGVYEKLSKTQNIVFIGLQKIDASSRVSLADEWQSAALIPALSLVDDHDLVHPSAKQQSTLLPSAVLQGIFFDVYNNSTTGLTRAFMNVGRFSSQLDAKQVDVLRRHIYAVLAADRMQDAATLLRLSPADVASVQAVWSSSFLKSGGQLEREVCRHLEFQDGCRPQQLFAILNNLVTKAGKIFLPSTFFSSLLLETIELNSEAENCIFDHLSSMWGPCAHAVLLAVRSCGATKPQLLVMLKFLRTVRTIIRFVSALRRSTDVTAHLQHLPLRSLRVFFSAEGQRNALVTSTQQRASTMERSHSQVSETVLPPNASQPGLIMQQTTVVLTALEMLVRQLMAPENDSFKTFTETVQDHLLGEFTKTQLGKIFSLLCNVMAQQPAEGTWADAEATRLLLCLVFISVRQVDALREQLRLPPAVAQVAPSMVHWACPPSLTDAIEDVSRPQRDRILSMIKQSAAKIKFNGDERHKAETTAKILTYLWNFFYEATAKFPRNAADAISVGTLQPLFPAVSVLTERELREVVAHMLQTILEQGPNHGVSVTREPLLLFLGTFLRSVVNHCTAGDAALPDGPLGEFPLAELKITSFVWLNILDDISEIYPISVFMYKSAFQQHMAMQEGNASAVQKHKHHQLPALAPDAAAATTAAPVQQQQNDLSYFASFLGLVHSVAELVAKPNPTSAAIQQIVLDWIETISTPKTAGEPRLDSAIVRRIIACGSAALVRALEKTTSAAAVRVFGPMAKLACQKGLFFIENIANTDDYDNLSMSSSSNGSNSGMVASTNLPANTLATSSHGSFSKKASTLSSPAAAAAASAVHVAPKPHPPVTIVVTNSEDKPFSSSPVVTSPPATTTAGGGPLPAPPTAVSRTSVTLESALPSFTMAEIAKHKSRTDCWIVIHGKVYDVSKLVATHPGGSGALIGASGKDSTQTFLDNHDEGSSAHRKVFTYLIGELKL